MHAMDTTTQFDTYIAQATQLAPRIKHDEDAMLQLQRLIVLEKEEADTVTLQEFLSGEEAFYNGKYQIALKHYLQAKSVPNYKFFCYRASAYVAHSRKEDAKALNFAREANALFQDDYFTLAILHELLNAHNHPEEALEINKKIIALESHQPSFESIIQAESSIPVESSMHTPPGILASPEKQPSFVTEELTNRLYDMNPLTIDQLPFSRPHNEPETVQEHRHVPLPHVGMPALTLPEALNQTNSLEVCIQSFQKRQRACIAQYLEQLKRRPLNNDFSLHVLHGYPTSTNDLTSENSPQSELLLTDKERRTSGGYYIRWNGKGIVINPGTNFLKHFHQQGLHIKDINYVIVTNADRDTHADIKEIYDLNYQLNNANSELQIIHYFLNQKAYQTLSPLLKPNFKQERNTVHCLELFLDSPDVEKMEIDLGITLHYFPTNGKIANANEAIQIKDSPTPMPTSLGIRLDLQHHHAHGQKTIRLGYVTGTPWSPLLAHHLGACDVLIAGFGSTNSNDYCKLKYNETSLGYFGSYSLLEEVHPRLFLCSEFSGNEGDIRVEVIKLMRKEYANAYPNARQIPAILPADPTLIIDLNALNIQCSITKAQVPPAQIHIVKSQASFGNLRFLAPSCCT